MDWKIGAAAAAACSLLLSATAGAQTAAKPPLPSPTRAQAQARLSAFTSTTLTRFRSEEKFRAYADAVYDARQAARQQSSARPATPASPVSFGGASVHLAGAASAGLAQDTPAPVCEDPELCPPVNALPDARGEIVVTGMRLSANNNSGASNPSITNNQMQGVDEGDIVKQINNHLVILQDGRLFVVDIRAGGEAPLALTDRMDVYRNAESNAWYDEMLVEGDRILVTAYSYEEDATELSVFQLSSDGRLSRQGVFLISSDDYYSATNYATRVVGDSLVVYTPYGLVPSRGQWPTVRRWLPEEQREQALRRGTRLYDAQSIYRPVSNLTAPTVHTITVCPLTGVGEGRDLQCRATAFAGPGRGQLYVTSRHAYVWTTPHQSDDQAYYRSECETEGTPPHRDVLPATAYRVTIATGALEVAGARGVPIDQFSFEASDRALRALLTQRSARCYRAGDEGHPLAFFDMPLTGFGRTLRELPQRHYTRLPSTGGTNITNRFTDTHLVYGSLSREGREDVTEEDWKLELPRAFAVPIANPAAPERLDVRHTMLRAERVGNDIVLTGYSDRSGLRISYVDLGGAEPRIASTVHLPKRYESEGRSHAFNSITDASGAGMIGLPTVLDAGDSDRYVSRSEASDLSYLALDRRGRLFRAGELEAARRSEADDEDEDGVPDAFNYQCEVSCIDWYGNSRPIFTDNRIFGLTGTELIEGRMEAGRIRLIGRVDITRPPPAR